MRTNSCMKVSCVFCMTVALCFLAASNAYANYYPVGEEFTCPSSALIWVFLEVFAVSSYFKKSCGLESVKFRLSLYALNISTVSFLAFTMRWADSQQLSFREFLYALIFLEMIVMLIEGNFIYLVLNYFFLTDKKVSLPKCIAVSVAGNIISFISGTIATCVILPSISSIVLFLLEK